MMSPAVETATPVELKLPISEEAVPAVKLPPRVVIVSDTVMAAPVEPRVTAPPCVVMPRQERPAVAPPSTMKGLVLRKVKPWPSPEMRAMIRVTKLSGSSRAVALAASMISWPALISVLPAACETAPDVASSFTVPSAPETPEPVFAPPRAVIVPATDRVDPPDVSVTAPALPPLLSLAVAA